MANFFPNSFHQILALPFAANMAILRAISEIVSELDLLALVVVRNLVYLRLWRCHAYQG